MKKLWARIKVLAKAAPTYLTIAAVVVPAITTQIADAVSGNWQTEVIKVGGWVVTAIGVATAIVRRVTPVLEHEKGLLTPPSKVG